jgi:signal peptidase II
MDEPCSQPLSNSPFPLSRLWLMLPLTAGCIGWDLYSKSAVFADLGFPAGQGQLYRWLGDASTFCLFTSFNEGALWGMGQGLTWFFALLSIVAVGVIVYFLVKTPAGRSNWLTVALCLVLSGTLGNLYDRLGLHGYTNPDTGQPIRAVRDFLLFTFWGWPWPVFNFADVFLVTGTVMLVVYSFWSDRQTARLANPPIGATVEPPARMLPCSIKTSS